MSQSYKELEIYKLSFELAVKVHEMSMTLPRFEMYEEGSQIRRSAKSVVSNIVEGFGRRRYKAEFVQFLTYALASCDETVQHLEMLYKTKSLKDIEIYLKLLRGYEELGKKIVKFIQAVEFGHLAPQKKSGIRHPASGISSFSGIRHLVSGICLLLLVSGIWYPASAFGRQAILSQFTGTVEVQKKGALHWVKATPKMLLNEYEKIRTLKKSKAVLLFEDGSRTTLMPETTLLLEKLIAPINLNQDSGRTRNKVTKLGRGFSLRTPVAVASVRGTDFSVEVGEGGVTRVDVFEGVVNGLKLATNESVDLFAGQSLTFTPDAQPLPAPQRIETPTEESSLKQLARKEVGLDMTREQVMAAAAEEIRLAEYREGKSLIDVNGNRVRLEEYILRKPKDVPEVDRDKAFKFVVLNTRGERLDFFTYKGIFNKALPEDLSIALKNVRGRVFGDEPPFYLRSYEMTQSNLTDAIKDVADGGHLVKVTFDGTDYTLQAYSVGADGKAGTVTDTVSQSASANGKIYDPVADIYREPGVPLEEAIDPALSDTFRTMKQGDTLWRTVFNRYVHMMGSASQLANLGLSDAASAAAAGTLSQPYFQYYSPRPGVTNIATLESYNNAALSADGTFASFTTPQGKSLELTPDQNIGDASFKYLNGRFASDSTSPSGADKLNLKLITYYPSQTEIGFEEYNTFIISDEGKIADIGPFVGKRRGTLDFNSELVKWNYQQITRSSAFGGNLSDTTSGRTIDIVAEPRILIRSGLLSGPEPK